MASGCGGDEFDDVLQRLQKVKLIAYFQFLVSLNSTSVGHADELRVYETRFAIDMLRGA